MVVSVKWEKQTQKESIKLTMKTQKHAAALFLIYHNL